MNEAVKIEMSKKGSFIYFSDFVRSIPLIVYSDFESIIKPIHACKPNPEINYIKQ